VYTHSRHTCAEENESLPDEAASAARRETEKEEGRRGGGGAAGGRAWEGGRER